MQRKGGLRVVAKGVSRMGESVSEWVGAEIRGLKDVCYVWDGMGRVFHTLGGVLTMVSELFRK